MEKIESHHKSPKADSQADLKAEKPSLEVKDEKSQETTTASIESSLDNAKKSEDPKEEEWEYITGFKLFAVTFMITLACFILLLDTSIVATVNNNSTKFDPRKYAKINRQFLKSPLISTAWKMWDGMAVVISWPSKSILFSLAKSCTNIFSCALTPMTGKIYSRFSTKVCYQRTQLVLIYLIKLSTLTYVLWPSSVLGLSYVLSPILRIC